MLTLEGQHRDMDLVKRVLKALHLVGGEGITTRLLPDFGRIARLDKPEPSPRHARCSESTKLLEMGILGLPFVRIAIMRIT